MQQQSDITKPIKREREWVRYDFHYDNVPKVKTYKVYNTLYFIVI